MNFFIQHRALNVMYKYYADDQYVSLDPAIIFGHKHSYSTRAPPHFANVVRCQLSFTKKFFVHQLHLGGTNYQIFYLTLHYRFVCSPEGYIIIF